MCLFAQHEKAVEDTVLFLSDLKVFFVSLSWAFEDGSVQPDYQDGERVYSCIQKS